MSEQSFDPAFDDTRASGRGAPPRSVSRVVEPVVEAHVESGAGLDDPVGRSRLGITLSREQREWVDKEARRRGLSKGGGCARADLARVRGSREVAWSWVGRGDGRWVRWSG